MKWLFPAVITTGLILSAYWCWLQNSLPADTPSLRAQAQQGDPAAEASLGAIYLNATGMQGNNEEAYFWLSLAQRARDEQGLPHWTKLSRDIETSAAHLTPEQLAVLKQRISQWRPDTAPR